jgi:hypothetical protein
MTLAVSGAFATPEPTDNSPDRAVWLQRLEEDCSPPRQLASNARAGLGNESAAQSSATSTAKSNAAAIPASSFGTPSTQGSSSTALPTMPALSAPSFLPNSAAPIDKTVAPSTASQPGFSLQSQGNATDNSSAASSATSNQLSGTPGDSVLGTLSNPAAATSNLAPAQLASPAAQNAQLFPAHSTSEYDGTGAGVMPGSSAQAQLRGAINQNQAAPSNAVESFFQCAPIQNLPPGPAVLNSRRTDLQHKAAASAEQDSIKGKAGRFMWHVLDNAGIPMPLKGKEDGLDPSLRRSYTNPPLPDIERTNIRDRGSEELVQSTIQSSTTVDVRQKIPLSELEGVEISQPKDESPQSPKK